MSESPYFPFYPSDWLGGTRGLTAAETGVYITLIAHMYEREGPISMPLDRMARMCGATVTNLKSALETLVSEGKLIEVDGGYWSKRVECECQKRSAKRESAKSSAAARWEKSVEKQRKPDANAMRAQCETDANQNQNQNQNIEPNGSMAASPAASAIEAYNKKADMTGWPKVQAMSKPRLSAMSARLKDAGGMDGWESALDRAAASDFLCNRTGKFTASFDWLTKPANLAKLIEGNYDNKGAAYRPAAIIPAGEAAANTAKMIRAGLVAHVSRQQAEAAVEAGAITIEECKKAGAL